MLSFVARSPLVARYGRLFAVVGLVGVLTVAAAPLVRSQTSTTASDDTRLRRTIRGMEEMFDDVFVESRNVLVQSHEATQGHYIPEFGILFTAEVSLLNRWSITRQTNWNWSWDDDDDDGDSARMLTRQEKQYKAFKEEMTEALMAGGDNFGTRLDGSQWVGISIALEDSRYFKKHKLNQLQIKARAGDLKAFADGTITEASMRGKIVTTES
ncbi:MAG: hypothetical protein SGI90_08830 [Candidatus Eisenbacteria bacterium]|nr:hypothetical protein [Candidatus Eisenbacteria bacterium]